MSTCHAYLKSRWNRKPKNALTTIPLDWSITQIELEGIVYPKTKQTPQIYSQQAPFELKRGAGRICVQNLASGDSTMPLLSKYRISPAILILRPPVRAVSCARTCHRKYLFTWLNHERKKFHQRFRMFRK